MKRIVITGGPCGGKSTILDVLQDEFKGKIQVVPEVATMLLSGFPMPNETYPWTEEWQALLQASVLPVQMSMETAHAHRAKVLGCELLVCDRGILDGASYTPGGLDAFCSIHNIDADKALARYDAVIHLESLATSDPEEYQRKRGTNSARFEGVERAQVLEHGVLDAWKYHPQRLILRGETHILAKIQKVTGFVREFIALSSGRQPLRRPFLFALTSTPFPGDMVSIYETPGHRRRRLHWHKLRLSCLTETPGGRDYRAR